MNDAATQIQKIARGIQGKQQALKRVKEVKKAVLEQEAKKGIQQLKELQVKANKMKQLRDTNQAIENQLIQQNQTRGKSLTYRNKKQLEQQIAGVKDDAIITLQAKMREKDLLCSIGEPYP